MYCPKCRAEFREGFTHCNECDRDLVAFEELDNYIDEEFSEDILKAEEGTLLCPECHQEYRDDFKICSKCNVELVKQVWINSMGENVDTSDTIIDLDSYENLTDLSECETVVLLESDDLEFLGLMMEELNKENIEFHFYHSDKSDKSLGGIMATNVPTEPNIHSIYVKKEDEEKALEIIQQGINENLSVPEEFEEEEED